MSRIHIVVVFTSLQCATMWAGPACGQGGPVSIKGTRYVDGSETRISCAASSLNLMYFDASGTKRIQFSPEYPLIQDADSAGEMVFFGRDWPVDKNGIDKKQNVYSGLVTSPPGHQGALSGLLRFSGSSGTGLIFNKDSGELTYSYFDGTRDIIFIGSYKARCDEILVGSCGP